jgi:hypothetical protein
MFKYNNEVNYYHQTRISDGTKTETMDVMMKESSIAIHLTCNTNILFSILVHSNYNRTQKKFHR